MRLLTIHANSIRYKVKRKTPIAEEITKKEDEMRDCLVVFSCVEKLDEKNTGKVVAGAKKEIIDITRQLKTKSVMLFPFAHLTQTLSTPAVALQVLIGLEKELKKEGLNVKRAPFGWYKEFEIKDKGHPLSELSRTICPYDSTDCDFVCPHCSNPIKIKDAEKHEKER